MLSGFAYNYVYIIYYTYELQRFDQTLLLSLLWLSRVCVYVSVRSFLPSRASRPRNIDTYNYIRVLRDTENSFIIIIIILNRDFLLKMLRSEATAGVICLPRMPLTTPEPQNTDTNGIHTTR